MTSLVNQLVAILSTAEKATIDDLRKQFPDKTRQQIHIALCGAANRGLVRRASPGRAGRQKTQAIWEIAPQGIRSECFKAGQSYASVWDYAIR